jgi:hypothetical protein
MIYVPAPQPKTLHATIDSRPDGNGVLLVISPQGEDPLVFRLHGADAVTVGHRLITDGHKAEAEDPT